MEYGDYSTVPPSEISSTSISDEHLFSPSGFQSSEALLTLTIDRFFPRLYRRIGAQDMRLEILWQ